MKKFCRTKSKRVPNKEILSPCIGECGTLSPGIGEWGRSPHPPLGMSMAPANTGTMDHKASLQPLSAPRGRGTELDIPSFSSRTGLSGAQPLP